MAEYIAVDRVPAAIDNVGRGSFASCVDRVGNLSRTKLSKSVTVWRQPPMLELDRPLESRARPAASPCIQLWMPGEPIFV